MAAIDFPATPTLNQLFNASNGATYQWNGTVWVPVGVGGSTISVGDTPPGSPVIGQLWWNSALGQLFIWYDDGTSQQWVPTNPVPMGAMLLSGTGAPTMTAAKGTLYTRVDATTATTRLYVNTNGGTTWANFTASA